MRIKTHKKIEAIFETQQTENEFCLKNKVGE